MDDLISRAAATRAAVISVRDYLGNIDSERDIHIEEGLYEVPAVEAVPVVHASWRELKDGTEECTNCLGLCPHEENYNGDVIFNFGCEYCPWCGAKMDGKRRDSE